MVLCTGFLGCMTNYCVSFWYIAYMWLNFRKMSIYAQQYLILGINVFTCSYEKFHLYRLVCKLQTFVYVAVTKKFIKIFLLINLPYFWSSLRKSYTLVHVQVHGQYNEQRIKFVRQVMVSACRIFLNVFFCTYRFIHALLLYLPYHITYEAKTLPLHSSVPAKQQRNYRMNLDKCTYVDSFLNLCHE